MRLRSSRTCSRRPEGEAPRRSPERGRSGWAGVTEDGSVRRDSQRTARFGGAREDGSVRRSQRGRLGSAEPERTARFGRVTEDMTGGAGRLVLGRAAWRGSLVCVWLGKPAPGRRWACWAGGNSRGDGGVSRTGRTDRTQLGRSDRQDPGSENRRSHLPEIDGQLGRTDPLQRPGYSIRQPWPAAGCDRSRR
jgi:hypothetical protein